MEGYEARMREHSGNFWKGKDQLPGVNYQRVLTLIRYISGNQSQRISKGESNLEPRGLLRCSSLAVGSVL